MPTTGMSVIISNTLQVLKRNPPSILTKLALEVVQNYRRSTRVRRSDLVWGRAEQGDEVFVLVVVLLGCKREVGLESVKLSCEIDFGEDGNNDKHTRQEGRG